MPVEDSIRRIPLSQGKEAIVDAADFESLSRWKWYALQHRRTFYAIRCAQLPNKKRVNIAMHRQLLNHPEGAEVDHWDGDGLNNCRQNLRVATTQQNAFNRRIPANNTSGIKGVYWCKHKNRWRASIGFNRRRIALGYFKDKALAGEAYAKAALELFGEFARV